VQIIVIYLVIDATEHIFLWLLP